MFALLPATIALADTGEVLDCIMTLPGNRGVYIGREMSNTSVILTGEQAAPLRWE